MAFDDIVVRRPESENIGLPIRVRRVLSRHRRFSLFRRRTISFDFPIRPIKASLEVDQFNIESFIQKKIIGVNITVNNMFFMYSYNSLCYLINPFEFLFLVDLVVLKVL